ncbi:MAG: Ig-like domain-containing protein [Oscillospiraceae bacterium]|nr:Ig-like domain-containing protein [Oscillospiraceae bacterium]
MKKLLSLMLALLLTVGFIPVATTSAQAADSSVGLLQLMRGFNVLSGKELTNLNTTNNILKAGASNALSDYYDFTQATETDTFAMSGKSMVEFALNSGVDLKIEASGNVSVGKLFKASAGTKFNRSSKAAYSNSEESWFYQFGINHTHGKNEIKNFDSINTQSAIQSQLDPTFINDLKNADPFLVFQKYGTHFITSYAMGGWSEFTASTIATKEASSENISTLNKVYAESSAKASGVSVGGKVSAELGVDLSTEYNKNGFSSSSSNRTRGGIGGITFTNNEDKVTETYNAWLRTFTPVNSYILVDQYLQLRGIWELLPDGYEVRYNQLMNEYIKRSIAQDLDFFDQFIYKSTGKKSDVERADVIDAAEYNHSANPVSEMISITTADEFANIGSSEFPLNGKYILTADIDLTGKQLALEGQIFDGTFNGNGKTITYKLEKDTFSTSTDENVGLFPTNTGTIKNLIVKDSEIKWENTSPRLNFRKYNAGIIAGLNIGKIENCRVESSQVNIVGTIGEISGGGIAGKNSGTISQCNFFGGKIVGNTFPNNALINYSYVHMGGIVGYAQGGSVSDSYTNTSVKVGTSTKKSGGYAGGIAGIAGVSASSFSNCFSVGTAEASGGDESVRGYIAGWINNPNIHSFSNCFYLSGKAMRGTGNIKSEPEGIKAVANYKIDEMVSAFTKSGWEYKTTDSHPMLPEIETMSGIGSAFVVEFKNKDIDNRPTFEIGYLLPQNLSSDMRVYFTPAAYVTDPMGNDITDKVTVRYSFASVGSNDMLFIYDDGTTTYNGTFSVNVQMPYEPVTSISLDKNTLSLREDGTAVLTTIITPVMASNQSVTWVSSNENVAVVDETGRVSAVASGSSIVTATTADGGYSAQCTVTVGQNVGDGSNNINYDIENVFIPGSGANGVSINLTQETITLGDYKPAAFSTDGGSKWKPVKDALGAAKFPKLLNKDMTLHLSDKPIEKSTKQPPEDATIVTFAAIEKRATAPKLTVNYEIAADKTGTMAGEWVLSEKGGTEAVKKDILVGVASGKNVDGNGFGQFSANGGIAVQGAKKTTYFIKIGPAESGGKYTAASKAKKVSAAGQTKAPTYKVNTKAEKKDKDGTVKTPASAIIKVKANTYVSISGGTPTLYSAKEDLDVLNVTGTIELWMAGTAKKPASVKQTITR